MKRLFYLFFSLSVCAILRAQTDTLVLQELEPVYITGRRAQVQTDDRGLGVQISGDELQGMPVTTLNDMLDYLPGVDIRSRGAGGSQADISLRGGTFDQVVVLLNGINLTDPHTGHYSLDLPIDITAVDDIEVLHGAMSLFALDAFAGAVNIVTKPLTLRSKAVGTRRGVSEQRTKNKDYSPPPPFGHLPPSRGGANKQLRPLRGEMARSARGGEQQTDWSLKIRMAAGWHKMFNPAVSAKVRHGIWWLNTMAEHNRSEGYMHNTQYHITNAYVQTGWDDAARSGNWQLQAGGQLKDYGANAFYSLKYPEQYETTKMLFAAAQWSKILGRFSIDASAYWRGHYDCFELIRQRSLWPSWYTGHNYHVTHVAAANAMASYLSRIGGTSVGIQVRDEYIKSNVLGDPLSTPKRVPFGADTTFLYAKNRLNINYFADQVFFWRDLTASIGFAGNYNTMFGNNFSFGASIDYEFTQGGSVFANVSRSLRLPTFTDLYYKSATQIANPDLKPEKSVTAELGIKWRNSMWNTQLTAYYRHGSDIIDWVKRPDEEQWHSMNHTAVNAMGGEAVAGWRYGYWVKQLQVSYAFTHIDKNAGEMLSKYALDYLRHKVTLRFHHGIYKGLGASWVLSMQSRHGDYTDISGNVVSYTPFWTLDGKIYWKNEFLEMYIECSNLFDKTYYDYGGLPQPGRWLRAGVVVSIN